jgi:HK97 family phage major capsid protein
MTEQIRRLRERRQRVWDHANTIATQAAEDNRALASEEEKTWRLLNKEVDEIDERVAELGGSETRARENEQTMTSLRGRGRPAVTDSALNDEFRSAVLERNPKPIDVRAGDFPAVTNGLEVRATLTEATANLYPVSFYSTLVEHLVETAAVLRAGATLVTTESGEDLRVPKTTALSSAAIVPETNTIPTSDPGLGVATLGAFQIRDSHPSQLGACRGRRIRSRRVSRP